MCLSWGLVCQAKLLVFLVLMLLVIYVCCPNSMERDLDTFFSLFERVADARGWPDVDRTLMLQCVFTGKAQEAYSALSLVDGTIYSKVKAAVLKAYELVPEAYRQRFRGGKRGERQTHVELARDISAHFARWCSASDVDSFNGLCDLIVLEQFKNSVPHYIAIYINECRVSQLRKLPFWWMTMC